MAEPVGGTSGSGHAGGWADGLRRPSGKRGVPRRAPSSAVPRATSTGRPRAWWDVVPREDTRRGRRRRNAHRQAREGQEGWPSGGVSVPRVRRTACGTADRRDRRKPGPGGPLADREGLDRRGAKPPSTGSRRAVALAPGRWPRLLPAATPAVACAPARWRSRLEAAPLGGPIGDGPTGLRWPSRAVARHGRARRAGPPVGSRGAKPPSTGSRRAVALSPGRWPRLLPAATPAVACAPARWRSRLEAAPGTVTISAGRTAYDGGLGNTECRRGRRRPRSPQRH